VTSERTPPEQVAELMSDTQWTIGDWCAHLSDEEMLALRSGGRVAFWGFSGLDEYRDGVSTCIISAEVLAAARRLGPDLSHWSDLFPVELSVL
jgi:hypothetical protein